ncbi:hypothetical protein BDD12DRAFT_215720 [Trichophaea hybrida]|nr:hypothetical protein BDD12DRAFT_215720 [Trichophaea hybrida]
MRHPIQSLHICPATSHLYTATSNSLHAFDASAGTLLSSWTAPQSSSEAPSTKSTVTEISGENDTDANPKKKRKVEEINASPKLGKKEKKSDRTRLSLFAGIVSNNAISKILTTADGKYVVIATSEDKAVTVFSVEDGKLEVLSARHLPKRIVDLGLVENDAKILCADKFGDVFRLPLLPPASDSQLKPSLTSESALATGTSVHDVEITISGKLEKVYESGEQKQRHLEKQRAHRAREQAAAERRKRLQVDYNIQFTHDFVLGHVSMLLSLFIITLPADHPQAAGKEKTWVLTSDRDEHIRITRYPQSFIIERFCLGHTQFVKTMLAPSWELTTLISGGGMSTCLCGTGEKGRWLRKWI